MVPDGTMAPDGRTGVHRVVDCNRRHRFAQVEMRTLYRRGHCSVWRQPHASLVGHVTDVGRDRVGRVRYRNRWRTADGARAAVDGQAGWQSR